MTTDNFILEKKRDKFNQAWDKLNRIFNSQKEINVSNMTFHRRKTRDQYYIICTQKGKPKIILNKGDLERAFVFNHEYMKELGETKKSLHDKKFEGDGVSYYYKEGAVDKEIMGLAYEQKYISCLLARCGCNLKIEKLTDSLNLAEVGSYIKKQDSSTISSYYYEFKHYGVKKLQFVAKTKKRVDDVLFGERFDNFRRYCSEQNLKLIYELLIFPYYSRRIVEKFGVETIQKIIQVVTGTIEIILIDAGGTNFDLSDLV